MATVYAIGTNQTLWSYLAPLTYSGVLHDNSAYAHRVNAVNWPSDTGSGVYVVGSLAEANNFALTFFGAGEDDDAAEVKIWGISQTTFAVSTSEYIGHYLATLKVYLGSATATGGSFGTGTVQFVDRIDVVDDATNSPPGLRIIGDASGGRAIVLHDSLGFKAYAIQLRRTADTAGWADSIGVLTRVV
jgi:hypothetical protein